MAFAGGAMTTAVERIVDQVKLLDQNELEELLEWLADQQLSEIDAWDKEIELDSQPDGRLAPVIARAREDIAAGRTKPLDEVINNT